MRFSRKFRGAGKRARAVRSPAPNDRVPKRGVAASGYDVMLIGLPGDRQVGRAVIASTLPLPQSASPFDIAPTLLTLLAWQLTKPWMRCAAALLALCATLPGEVRTPGEFLLNYAISLSTI